MSGNARNEESMRGYKQYFYYLAPNTYAQFFVVSEPQQYKAHYVDTPSSGKVKKNCHEVACPYCEAGIPLRPGLFTIILGDRGELHYFDISKAMYMAMSKAAKAHAAEAGEEFTDMGAFLNEHMVILLKKDQPSGYIGYDVRYEDVAPGDMQKIRSKLADINSKLGKQYRTLLIGFPDIVRPGTPEEDREGVYAL
jgi:hypothetical protein